MADEPKAEEGGGGSSLHIDAIFWTLLAVFFLQGIWWFFTNGFGLHFNLTNTVSIFFDFLKGVQFLAIFSSLVFIFGLIFIHQKMKQFSHHGHGHGGGHGDHGEHDSHDHSAHDSQEHDKQLHSHASEHYHEPHADSSNSAGPSSQVTSHSASMSSSSTKTTVKKANEKWQNIVAYSNSDNSNDWRLAIIEADALLDDMLKKIGYEGETMGDRLKEVNRAEFKSIDSAWQAHRIRNAIAHEGSGFKMSKREAVRIIGLYEEVFKEFYLI